MVVPGIDIGVIQERIQILEVEINTIWTKAGVEMRDKGSGMIQEIEKIDPELNPDQAPM